MLKRVLHTILLLLIVLFLPFLLSLAGSKKKADIFSYDTITITCSSQSGLHEMDFETYLIGVVAACMPAGYELEALKCQAVIARTYALYQINHLTTIYGTKDCYDVNELSLPFLYLDDLENIWGSEQYLTYYSRIENAVYATRQETITYKNHLILPMFFSNGCGYTRDMSDLSSVDYPYLVSVSSEADKNSTNYMKITEHSIDSMIEILQKYNPRLTITEDNFFQEVMVDKRDSIDYVLEVNVQGTILTGEEFAHLFSLPSSHFTLEPYQDGVRIVTIGIGHGIGFSQYGANEMAKNKSSYEEILCHYYANIQIQNSLKK